jgi:RimJ/RimL family protein N-acetyltransferase
MTPLVLRRIKREDLKKMFDARNDLSIMKWCRQQTKLHWCHHLDWFKWQKTDPNTEMFAIVAQDPDSTNPKTIIVGVCGLTGIDRTHRRAEFSLYIFPDMHQNGYGRESLEKLFQIGFESLNLNLIWGESFKGNPAISMFKDLGMTQEGIRRDFYYKNGKYIDAILYSIKESEFNV